MSEGGAEGMPVPLFRSPVDKYAVSEKCSSSRKLPDPTGNPSTVRCCRRQRAHTPTAACSSIREYLWSPSLSKHAMASVLGVDAPNALLRFWCVSPRDFCPIPACRNRSSKSVRRQFEVCHREKSKCLSLRKW